MKTKSLLLLFLGLGLIVLGYFLMPKLSRSSKPAENSIAVLPFSNNSPDDANSYFVNGIMEETLNNLSKVEDIKVLSRMSVEPYRNSTMSIPDIGNNLKVTYIIEGSGQKSGNTFKLDVQLINAVNATHIWAKTYEYGVPEASDIYSIQSQIAQDIQTEIKKLLTPQKK